jgi:hypothetical protein
MRGRILVVCVPITVGRYEMVMYMVQRILCYLIWMLKVAILQIVMAE